ncbi:hypothetical protein AK812_SmicGene32672 [Symbiodinium microadriaticum]|uniref:Reverse transcriptase domain-containing protein n=1 Tax=Symbiodinium microadriaticum TaxID=2951 RepID=A0A1Q9CTL6_SYMMI|nr:hypothetical protein AK812_SmicGene32672 [Symbiodinium microadriaticum]
MHALYRPYSLDPSQCCHGCGREIPRPRRSQSVQQESRLTRSSAGSSSKPTVAKPHGGIPFLKADIDSPGAGSWLHGDSAMGAPCHAVRTLQQQLQGAEAMLATCNQVVEAAWALASQRLTAFDSRLSQLDLKLAALSQKQNQVYEDQDTLPRHETDLRLSLLEQRFEALQQRISMPSSPEKDGLGLRLASLSERLSAEARVREEQFRRLESMFRAHLTKESERSPETRTPNAFAGQSSLQAQGSQVESGRPVRGMRPCESADDFWNVSLTLPRPQVPLCLAGLSASTPALTSSGAWISNLSPSTLGPSGMPRGGVVTRGKSTTATPTTITWVIPVFVFVQICPSPDSNFDLLSLTTPVSLARSALQSCLCFPPIAVAIYMMTGAADVPSTSRTSAASGEESVAAPAAGPAPVLSPTSDSGDATEPAMEEVLARASLAPQAWAEILEFLDCPQQARQSALASLPTTALILSVSGGDPIRNPPPGRLLLRSTPAVKEPPPKHPAPVPATTAAVLVPDPTPDQQPAKELETSSLLHSRTRHLLQLVACRGPGCDPASPGRASHTVWRMERGPAAPLALIPLSLVTLSRTAWSRRLLSDGLATRVASALNSGSRDPPLSDSDLEPFLSDLRSFLGITDEETWHQLLSVQPGQRFRLNLWHRLSLICADPDSDYFDILRVMAPPAPPDSATIPLQHCESSWKSEIDHSEIVDDLLQEELAQGWIAIVSGGDEALRREYSVSAVGKLGVVLSEGRPPRLVVDSSVPATLSCPRGLLVRLVHQLIRVRHSAKIYVDDLLCLLDCASAPVWASHIVILLLLLKVPLSWHKCALSARVVWIGWELDVSVFTVRLDPQKFQRLCTLLRQALASRRCSTHLLERITGKLLWLSSLFKTFRPSLAPLYADQHAFLPTMTALDPQRWNDFRSKLSEDLRLLHHVGLAALPPGSRILRVGQSCVSSLSELPLHPLDSRRIWIQSVAPHTGICILSEESVLVLRLWLDLAESGTACRSLLRPPRLDCQAFADACASPTSAGFGGFVRLPDGRQLFFRDTFSAAELVSMFPWLPPQASVQSFISSWELLAQCALVYILHLLLGHSHLPVHCIFRCDNAAAESSSWKGLSMASGLCSVLRTFFLCQQRCRISVHIDHVPGIVNDVADALSRSADPSHLGFQPQEEVKIDWAAFCEWPQLSMFPDPSHFEGLFAGGSRKIFDVCLKVLSGEMAG